MNETLLIVDDDSGFRAGLRALLEGAGYRIQEAVNGKVVLEQWPTFHADLILLDIDMPGLKGDTVCRLIRERDQTIPILFLTSHVDELTQVCSLGTGGDDFIDKDASDRILLARIAAHLARSAARQESQVSLQIGSCKVDFRQMTLIGADGHCEPLTKNELSILRLMGENPGRYFSFDELFAVTHGDNYFGDDSTMRVQISRLKRKLGADGELIVNARGLGYALMQPK